MTGIRLLIVDDDPEIAAFIKLKLSREAPHFSIDTVEGGVECLEFIERQDVDCILSDYQMPGMNGIELLEELRFRGNTTPFIFITGQGNEEVAREAFKKGANDYFTKDIGFAHFPRVINSIEQSVRHSLSDADRARAEAALVEEKNKLEAIFASMPDGIMMVDQDFRILYQNARQMAVVGRHDGEVCYRSIHGRDAVCDGCMIAEAFSDGQTHTAQREMVREGETIYFENTATPVRDASGKVVACLEIVKNITAQKIAEIEAMERERLLDSVFDSIDDGILVMDRELTIIRANPAMWLASGQRKGLVGHKCYEVIMGRGKPCSDCPAVTTLRTAESSRREREIKDVRSDTSQWVEMRSFPMKDSVTGALSGVIEYIRDITERKRTEQELLAVKGRLEMLLTYNPSVIYSGMFDKKFTATFVSGNVRDTFGYEPEDFTSNPDFWVERIHPEDVERVLEGAGALLREGNYVAEYRFMRKDGIYMWVRDYVKLVRDSEGRPSKIFGSMSDIDEIKRHGIRKEEFYSMVSHDLKSPLVAIQGYAELIGEGDMPEGEIAAAAGTIQQSSKKLLNLINDFLDISRADAGKLKLYREPHDLGGLISRATEEITIEAAGKGLRLDVEKAESPVVAEMDQVHILRAISNLVQNAVKYTQKGGRILVRAYETEEAGRRYAVVEVSDNGPGIPAADQARVFDMYYRSGRGSVVSGSGLGLASVKAIVEAHGGRVVLMSEEGKGSKFSIMLPAAKLAA